MIIMFLPTASIGGGLIIFLAQGGSVWSFTFGSLVTLLVFFIYCFWKQAIEHDVTLMQELTEDNGKLRVNEERD